MDLKIYYKEYSMYQDVFKDLFIFSFRENREKNIFTLLSSQHNYSVICCSKYRKPMQTDELVRNSPYPPTPDGLHASLNTREMYNCYTTHARVIQYLSM